MIGVDDPAAAEFFQGPLCRQGLRMIFTQDPAVLDPGARVAGLRFRIRPRRAAIQASSWRVTIVSG